MIKLVQLSTIIYFLTAPAAMAGTIIEIQNNNEISAVMTDGRQARMNTGDSEYLIVDYKNQSARLVNPQKQQVILLDANDLASADNTPLVHTAVNSLGAGLDVAGYSTQKFAFTANGKSCGVIYGSKDAYQAQGIKELLLAMEVMMENQKAMLGGFASLVDDCTLADMSITNHVNTIGLPMRTERNGKVETEVKSIKTDVALPDDIFLVPSSYKFVNILGQVQATPKDISQMQQQVQQAQQYQPELPQMAQQTQPSSQLPPRAFDRMRQSQQMRPRYQPR